jgi:hypothetical protein
MNKLKIADEAAADIAKAGVVDIRCLEPDATRMMSVLFSFSGFEVAFQGGEGTAKGRIETSRWQEYLFIVSQTTFHKSATR